MRFMVVNNNRKRYLLGLVLTVFLLMAIPFYFEGIAYFGKNHGNPFTNFEFLISSLVLALLEISIFIVAKWNFKLKTKWWLFIPLLFSMVTGIVAILGYRGVLYEGETIATISSTARLRYIILTILLFVSLYELLVYVPHFVKGHRLIRIVFYIAVIVALAGTIYSYLVETDFYRHFFEISEAHSSFPVPQSFTPNRNSYALLLFFGMVGEAYLEVERPHWWRWILIVYFFASQLFVMSKTCLFISLLFFNAFGIYWIVGLLMRHRPTAASFLIILYVFLAGLFVIIWFGKPETGPLSFLGTFATFLQEHLGDAIVSSFVGRGESLFGPWRAISQNSFTLFFGFGYGNALYALSGAMTGNTSVMVTIDNAWGLSLGQNGLFGVLYNAALWIMFGIFILRAIIRKSHYAPFIIMLTTCLVARTVTENDSVAWLDFFGSSYYAICFLPLLCEEASLDRHENIGENEFLSEKPLPKNESHPSLALAKAFALLFVPTLAVICFFPALASTSGIAYFGNRLFLPSGVIMFAISSIVLGSILLTAKKKKTLFVLLSSLCFLLYLSTVFVLPLFTDNYWFLMVQAILLGLAFMVLGVGHCFQKEMFTAYTLVGNLVLMTFFATGFRLLFWGFAEKVTLYSTLALLAAIIVIAILLYFLPREASMFAPFDDEFKRKEDLYCRYRLRRETHFEEKTRKIRRLAR